MGVASEREQGDQLRLAYDAERLARQTAEAARTRAEFVARSVAMFGMSLDHERTLRAVASAAVPTIADWCVVDMYEGQDLRSVAVAHVEPSKVELARELRRKYPPLDRMSSGVRHVVRTGMPELYADISDELVRKSARDPEQLRLVREVGLRSAMLVPIKHHDHTTGVITFVLARSDRRYNDDDLQMAVQLGECAGAAIANAQLYEAATKAVRFNELFSTALGHDLRNPLASVMAGADLLLMRGACPEDHATLERIISSAERMSQMIDQLLDFTRIRSRGGLPSDARPMDMAEVARDAVAEMQYAHPSQDITLENVGRLDGVWDRERMAQLLSNLVSNAIQHGKHHAPVQVALDGTAANSITISVSNDGALSSDLVPAVFEPFQGAHRAQTHGSGLGLGLYIAQQIAIVHGGGICLVNSNPQRTKFNVTLPRTYTRDP